MPVCFAVLRQLRSVRRMRRSVPSSVFQTLIVSLVLTKLDFGNATLAGLPTNLLNRFQSVLKAAARSIVGLRRSDHVTDTFASFHWLRAPERTTFTTGGPCIPSSARFIRYCGKPSASSGSLLPVLCVMFGCT